MSNYLSPRMRQPWLASDSIAPSRLLHIHVELVCGHTSDVSGLDIQVPGLYEAAVASDLTDEQAASSALDGFNTTVAIECVGGFNFTVVDPKTGNVLEEDGDAHAGDFSHKCRSIRCMGLFPFVRFSNGWRGLSPEAPWNV